MTAAIALWRQKTAENAQKCQQTWRTAGMTAMAAIAMTILFQNSALAAMEETSAPSAPSTEEMWAIIQVQQQQIEALKARLDATDEKIEATEQKIRVTDEKVEAAGEMIEETRAQTASGTGGGSGGSAFWWIAREVTPAFGWRRDFYHS